MAKFTVAQVLDGDTFTVKERWSFTKSDGTKVTGDTVRPTGYNTPELGKPGSGETTLKLLNLLKGRMVELKNVVNISYGRIVCDVYLDGKNLADYFPEYKC